MNIKKWVLTVIGLLSFCIACTVTADSGSITSKDGLYEYDLEKFYGDTGVYEVARLTRYLGNEKTVRIPATIDGYPVYYLYQTFAYDSYPVNKVYLPDSVRSVDYPYNYNNV